MYLKSVETSQVLKGMRDERERKRDPPTEHRVWEMTQKGLALKGDEVRD